MTLATLGPVSSNFVVCGFALCAVFAFVIGAVVWAREGQLDDHDDELARHDEQLATLAYQMPKLLEFLRLEIPAPVVDDSPSALEAEAKPDEMPTDEIPVCPPTVPDGIPLAVHTALLDQRPSPVPRTDSDEAKARKAAWVEAELAKIRERIDAAQGAS